LYARAAYFRDPFNEMRSLVAIQAIFRKMYQQVDAPRFIVLSRYVADNGVTLTRDFSFQPRLPGKPQRHIHEGALADTVCPSFSCRSAVKLSTFKRETTWATHKSSPSSFWRPSRSTRCCCTTAW
jgi:hypothetical protein